MIDKELLSHFCSFLDKQLGLYYSEAQWPDLEKKLGHIRSSFKFDNTAACLEWLMKSPIDKEKIDILIFHLTVGETYFFRDTQLFAILEQKIIPDIIQRHYKDRQLKIWSAGCCTGEEPYSIAMLLHQLIPNIRQWNISILASDINSKFLSKAERGEYKKWSFRSTPPKMQKCYFEKDANETYSLIPEIKKMVQFRYLNLVDDVYPDMTKGINDMDLIFCHNVLIYFSKHQMKTTIRKLTTSLCNEGWLSVTAIEVPYIIEPALKAYRFPGAVFFKKEHPCTKDPQKLLFMAKPAIAQLNLKNQNQSLPSSPKSNKISSAPKAPKKVKNAKEILDECLDLYQRKAYREAIILLESYLTPFQNNFTAIQKHLREVILLIRSYANQGEISFALKWIEVALQADKLDPTLHYLNATLLQEQGNIAEAIKSLKNVIFIDHDFVMAYLMLGILEKQQGNKKAALHNFKTALKIVDKLPSMPVLLNEEEFSVDQIRAMISNNLKTL